MHVYMHSEGRDKMHLGCNFHVGPEVREPVELLLERGRNVGQGKEQSIFNIIDNKVTLTFLYMLTVLRITYLTL